MDSSTPSPTIFRKAASHWKGSARFPTRKYASPGGSSSKVKIPLSTPPWNGSKNRDHEAHCDEPLSCTTQSENLSRARLRRRPGRRRSKIALATPPWNGSKNRDHEAHCDEPLSCTTQSENLSRARLRRRPGRRRFTQRRNASR